jgi:hypothetical protein
MKKKAINDTMAIYHLMIKKTNVKLYDDLLNILMLGFRLLNYYIIYNISIKSR